MSDYPGPLRLSQYDVPRTIEAFRNIKAPKCTCDPFVRINMTSGEVDFDLDHETDCVEILGDFHEWDDHGEPVG